VPDEIIPVEQIENVTAPAEMPPVESVTVADKTIGKYKPADEFTPEPGIVELMPPIKAADRPAKADKPAGDVAAEIKQVRALAQAYGCKTVEQFKQCMEIAAGRAVEAASALNNDERKKAIEFLTEATKGN